MMLKNKFKFIIFFTFIFSGNLLGNIDNKIIAKIGDEIITGFDVENKIKTILFLSRSRNQSSKCKQN